MLIALIIVSILLGIALGVIAYMIKVILKFTEGLQKYQQDIGKLKKEIELRDYEKSMLIQALVTAQIDKNKKLFNELTGRV